MGSEVLALRRILCRRFGAKVLTPKRFDIETFWRQEISGPKRFGTGTVLHQRFGTRRLDARMSWLHRNLTHRRVDTIVVFHKFRGVITLFSE